MQGWGYRIQRRRWWVLGASALVLVASLVMLVIGADLHNSNNFDFEAGTANQYINDQLPKSGGFNAGFVAIDSQNSATLADGSGNPAFSAAVDRAFAAVPALPHVTSVVSYFTAPAAQRSAMVSNDRHAVIVNVQLNEPFDQARLDYDRLHSRLAPAGSLRVLGFGDVAVNHDFNTYLASDLQRAELVSIPLSILLLLLVFGSLTAALVSVAVGALAVVGGVAGMLLLAHLTAVSPFAENIVTLIGLGVAIDYSLFIVSRFREELARGRSVPDAVALAMSTAGRAIAFSGLTVAIGLGSLLFFHGTFLVSMGLAGSIVVAVAVLFALTFLPALLSVLGPRVDSSPWRWAAALLVFAVVAVVRFPIGLAAALPAAALVYGAARLAGNRLRPAQSARRRRRRERRADGHGAWHTLATWVMRRPITVLVPCLAILILLGLPFRSIHLVNGGADQLPAAAESRQSTDLLTQQFPGGDQSSSALVVHFADGHPLSAAHVGGVYDLAARLQQLHVGAVDAFTMLGNGTRAQAVQILAGPPSAWPATLADSVRASIGPTIAVIHVHSRYAWDSDPAHAEVRAIRAHDAVPGADVTLTGDTAFDIDFVQFMVGTSPLAVGFVMVSTALVLFLLLGSVVLPAKAVVMNLLSLTASFGAMVFIFQQGHLSTLLGFAAAPIDPTIPILLFCIVFGLSMDYEVFLLSRMQESWRQTGDNRHAVAEGLEHSGRLVSGAAAIMVCVFMSFGLAQVVLIKAIGTGMAVAVLVDATIVRALVVPAVMRLMGRLNWWAPPWLARLHQRLHVGEQAPAGAPAAGHADTAG